MTVQSTNDLFIFIFSFWYLTLFRLQTSASFLLLSTPSYQRQRRTFTFRFWFFVSLASFLLPFPFPWPFADAVTMRCLSVHCEPWTREGNKSRSCAKKTQRDVVVVFDYVWLTEKCENKRGKAFSVHTYCNVASSTLYL